MEDITQHQLSAAELLKSLAKEHQVPIEIAEQMAHLMARYPDLSLTGSRAELIDELEKILESAFKNKVVEVE
ncbi:DNA modification system-associated small protein [Nitrosomonas sp. wSCUT-2]